MNCTTKELPIATVTVSSRIRKDTGDIEGLAVDISKRGLINPITVMDCGDGKYQLIAGLRRLEAVKGLGYSDIRSSILSPMDAGEALRLEYAENVQRKDFTVTERLEYAEKIKAVERAKAKVRMSMYAREGYDDCDNDPSHCKATKNETGQGTDVRPYPEKGESRQAIAQRAGFSSYKQYERADRVAANRPDLLAKVETGETTIYGAYQQMLGERKESVEPPVISSADNLVHEKREKPDQVARAGHDRLMRNPLYAKLYTEKREAIEDANRAWADHDRKAAFFENQVKHFTNNIDALRQRCEKYLARIKELETQLGIEHTQEEYA